nr:hypothetical protein [Candidatus Sigynarchaeum springense]
IDEILLFTAKQREFGLPIKVSYSVKRGSFPFFENRNGEKSPDLTQFFEIFYNNIEIEPERVDTDRTFFIIARSDFHSGRGSSSGYGGDDWFEGLQKRFDKNHVLQRLRMRLVDKLGLLPSQVCIRVISC